MLSSAIPNILTMDDIERSQNWVHVVVDPLVSPMVFATPNYTQAKHDCIQRTQHGFLINISPETLAKIENGEMWEITI